MITDLDINRSAKVIMKQYGKAAPVYASMRADAMLDKGNLDAYAVWRLSRARRFTD